MGSRLWSFRQGPSSFVGGEEETGGWDDKSNTVTRLVVMVAEHVEGRKQSPRNHDDHYYPSHNHHNGVAANLDFV